MIPGRMTPSTSAMPRTTGSWNSAAKPMASWSLELRSGERWGKMGKDGERYLQMIFYFLISKISTLMCVIMTYIHTHVFIPLSKVYPTGQFPGGGLCCGGNSPHRHGVARKRCLHFSRLAWRLGAPVGRSHPERWGLDKVLAVNKNCYWISNEMAGTRFEINEQYSSTDIWCCKAAVADEIGSIYIVSGNCRTLK